MELPHRVDRLTALLDGIADQPHAAQLAGDEDSIDVGLKVGSDQRDVDAAGLGAEDQRYRVARTSDFACAVTDTLCWLDQGGLAVDHPEDISLRAGPHARPTTEAFHGIDDGMQRGWLRQTRIDVGRERGAAGAVFALAPAKIGGPDRAEHERVSRNFRIGEHLRGQVR